MCRYCSSHLLGSFRDTFLGSAGYPHALPTQHLPLSHFLDGMSLAQVPQDLLSISQKPSVIIARQPVGSALQPDVREGTWM